MNPETELKMLISDLKKIIDQAASRSPGQLRTDLVEKSEGDAITWTFTVTLKK
jgi:hypothetical protein